MPVALDTLEIAKRLRNAGFSEPQAEAVTGVLRDAREADLSQLATKAELTFEISRLETLIKTESAALRAEIELLRRDLTIRLGSMIVVATGVLLAAKFFS
jgi:hypothetical protein